MPVVKPTHALYGRLINKDRAILQKRPRYDNSQLDLEVEGLKQRIDCNIKRHMDIRCEIRTEIDKLRQENMDLAAMLHRTDETFYLHTDFNEEVHRLRSMNVRLKAMMCLQDVKSIETYGPTKSRSTYPKYTEQRKSPSYSTTSSRQDVRRADISSNSGDLFARIDKLEAGMRNFLVENPLPKRKEQTQQKHVSDIDIHCSAERITDNIRHRSTDDEHSFASTKTVKPQTRLQESHRTKICHANTEPDACPRKCQRKHTEVASYCHVDGPHTQSNFWIKDESFTCDKSNNIMKSSRSKCRNVTFNDIDIPIMNRHCSPDVTPSSDDMDVNMNSSRSEDRHEIFDNRDVLTINSGSKDKNNSPQDGDINMHHTPKDERVLSNDKDINMNSTGNLECMLVMVHPQRSQSGTIVGFDVAENFAVKPTVNFKSLHNETDMSYDHDPAQSVISNGVSNLMTNYVEDAPITMEDLEIRDIFKNASDESDSEQTTSSSDLGLKFATPFKIVSTKHIRPRDVPRLDLGDLVSESDINLVKIPQETIEDLLSDQDQSSSVSYIDLGDGSGCQHLRNENMSAADAQHEEGYCNEKSKFIDVTDGIANKDQQTSYDNGRKPNLSDMIQKLCVKEEMSYMQDFFRDDSRDKKAPPHELEVSTKHSIDELCALEGANKCNKSTWNDNLNSGIKLSSSVSQTQLNDDVHQVNVHDEDGSDNNTDMSAPVMPTDDEEERYAHYVELCNTTMMLSSIIKDMCANRSIVNKQELSEQPISPEEPRLPKIWDGRGDVIDNNMLHVPVRLKQDDQLVRQTTTSQHNWTNLSLPSQANDVKLDKNNFPWMFPNDGRQYENSKMESEERSTLSVTMPTCTLDSSRSDVSCIDLSLYEETPNLGSTRREYAVNTCFNATESPRCGVEEYDTNKPEFSDDDTDRFIVPSELALSCKRRHLLSTTLSESHEDIVRLLNWTEASKYVGAWKDPEHPKITDDENSVQEILISPDSMDASSQRKQLWKPCFLSEYMANDGEQANQFYGQENNSIESARSGYDLDSDISCIDLSEEVTTISSANDAPMAKEFLRHDKREINTREMSFEDLSPRWSTSVTSYDEETYFTDTEESCSLYYTASEDESVETLASPDSLVGYARMDQIWEEDFVANYMRRSSKEQNNKEKAKRLIAKANEDIDKIHAIRIPILLAEAEKHEVKDLLISDHKARVTFEAMDSARSDVSCIQLSEEEPTLSDIKEGHVVKEFLVCEEDNPGPAESGNDILESGRWAVPTNHTTHRLSASESSSDDQVIISDIENDEDGSDITCNDVTSLQAFSDTDSLVFDTDDPDSCFAKQDLIKQNTLHSQNEQVQTSTSPVLPFDGTDLHLDIDVNDYVIPRMSDVKKYGPRVDVSVWRELNSKLEKVKQNLMKSSGMSRWFTL